MNVEMREYICLFTYFIESYYLRNSDYKFNVSNNLVVNHLPVTNLSIYEDKDFIFTPIQ